MEDIEKKEDEETADTETEAEETSPETKETADESDEEESEKDIDYKGELEKLEKSPEKERSEAEKAARALHFNAQRARELGIDVEEALGIKKKKDEPDDVDSKLERKFAERDAQALAKTDDELKLIMWYVDNRNLSVDDAYVLANKGKIQRAISEGKRAQVRFAGVTGTERKAEQVSAPERSPEEQAVLQRRGMNFNAKTKTWQGKFYEEYWDGTDKMWKSRKLRR